MTLGLHGLIYTTTPDEAVRELLIAKKAWLEGAKARGRRIPRPRYRPAIYQAGP